jgi:hypothetical protein
VLIFSRVAYSCFSMVQIFPPYARPAGLFLLLLTFSSRKEITVSWCYHHKFEKWYSNPVATKQPKIDPKRQTSVQLDKGSDREDKERLLDLDNKVPRAGLLSNYCQSIPFLKLMLVTLAVVAKYEFCLHSSVFYQATLLLVILSLGLGFLSSYLLFGIAKSYNLATKQA